MICLFLSTKCEDHLDTLADVYEEVTGQIWNTAEFVENMLLELDPDMLRESLIDD